MSHSIKLSEPVYHKLRDFQGKRETYSEAVGRLLTLSEKMGELTTLIEGGIKYEEWKAEQLNKLNEAHQSEVASEEVDNDHRRSD